MRSSPHHSLLALALCLGFAAQSLAKVPETESPRFFLETIRVEGIRSASPEILLSEALLEEGREYSEGELRDAEHRIVRLPFILDARFALERGSERGKLGLLITVDEVRRFFFGGEVNTGFFADDLTLEGDGPNDSNTQLFSLAGVRFFPGRRSTLFLSIANGGAQAGYTRFGIGSRNLFLSLGYQHQRCCTVRVEPLGVDPTLSAWTSGQESDRVSFTLGMPLDHRNALRFELSVEEGDRGSRRRVLRGEGIERIEGYGDRRDLRVEAAWIRDTTDDPVFPTQGESFTLALEWRDFEAEFEPRQFPTLPPEAALPGTVESARFLRLAVAGTRHWPMGRHTLSAGFRVALGETRLRGLAVAPDEDDDLTTWEARLDLRHALDLAFGRHFGGVHEMLWETRLSLGLEGLSPSVGPLEDPLERFSLTTGLAYRTEWGIFRIGFTYLDLGTKA